MTSEGPAPGDRQRIEELEQEVQRLRARLDGGGAAGDPDHDHDHDHDGHHDDEAGGGGDRVPMPSRTRVIVIAALAGLIALIAVAALVVGMSRVIDPFSRKAAKAISPWEPDDEQGEASGQQAPAPRPEAPRQPPDDVPRAPGL